MGLPSLTLLLLTLLGVRGQGPALQGSFIWSPSAPAGQQAYVAFRSPSFLLSTLTSATVHIFADSRYLLYVNGEYILRGPCRFNPKWPEYDSVDVTASLRPGQNNSIVALVHSYGPVINGRIMSHAPGLALSLEVNGAPLLSSSPAWRSSRATQYQGSPPAWSSIPDVIDARALAPLGGDWTQPHFNDSAWEPSALVSGSAWGALQARSLPLPLEDPLPPPLALPAGAPLALPLTLQVGQSITLNLTQMAMVYAVVGLDAGAAGAGAVLHLEFALRFRGGAPAETYGVGTQYTASAGAQSFVSLDQWCAHYLTITCVSGSPLTLTSLSLVRRAYPFQRLGAFNSSDALVSEVWRRAVNTLAAVTDDAYGSDARERNEWLQDPAQPNFITTRVALVGPPPPGSSRPAFSDARLLKNLLRHAALSQLPDGRILSTFPTDRGPEDCHYAIEDYAMQFMEALRAYFDSSGDLAFVREVYPVVLAQMANFKGRVVGNGSASGAVSGLLLARQYTSFDDALAYVTVQGGALNAFYARSLGDCAYLAGLVGDAAQAAQFAAEAAAIASRFNDALWNASVGSYNSVRFALRAVLAPPPPTHSPQPHICAHPLLPLPHHSLAARASCPVAPWLDPQCMQPCWRWSGDWCRPPAWTLCAPFSSKTIGTMALRTAAPTLTLPP